MHSIFVFLFLVESPLTTLITLPVQQLLVPVVAVLVETLDRRLVSGDGGYVHPQNVKSSASGARFVGAGKDEAYFLEVTETTETRRGIRGETVVYDEGETKMSNGLMVMVI